MSTEISNWGLVLPGIQSKSFLPFFTKPFVHHCLLPKRRKKICFSVTAVFSTAFICLHLQDSSEKSQGFFLKYCINKCEESSLCPVLSLQNPQNEAVHQNKRNVTH